MYSVDVTVLDGGFNGISISLKENDPLVSDKIRRVGIAAVGGNNILYRRE